MRSIIIVLVWFLLYALIPIAFLSHRSALDRVIFYWLLLNVLVCIYEIAMILNSNPVCPTTATSWWCRDYQFTESFNSRFWIDGWLQGYGQFDPRYCQKDNYVYLFELGNIIVSLIPSILLLWVIASKNPIPAWYGTVAIWMSIPQFILTSGYYLTGIGSYRMRYWPYAFFDLPWLIMPLITIYWGYQLSLMTKLNQS